MEDQVLASWKAEKAANASLCAVVLGKLREGEKDAAIAILEDNLDEDILIYGIIRDDDTMLLPDALVPETNSVAWKIVAEYRNKYPSLTEKLDDKKAIREILKPYGAKSKIPRNKLM
jgi:hypothetical protein